MRRDDKARAVRSWVGKPRPVGSSGVKHRSKDAVDMITYDFQQNLETPNLQHNDMFYKRQLWTYNFGIHDCMSNKVNKLPEAQENVSDKSRLVLV